jgi:hypothetical protein
VIHDFRSYVAGATYHACHDHLRRKYPRRRRLKDGLRQTLIRDPRFAIWEEAGRSQLCGLAAWRKLAPVERRRPRVQPDEIIRAGLLNEDPGRMKQAELIAAILEHIGAPIELEELTGMVANLCGIKEYELDAAADGDVVERLVAPQIRADDELALREYVARLWEEILQLPQRQRVALLLSLKDAQGRSALSLFPLINVATLRRLAEALELTPEQFGEIWTEIPLNDAAIAARLGLTRQQVINLRKSARERLARRMKMFDEGG